MKSNSKLFSTAVVLVIVTTLSAVSCNKDNEHGRKAVGFNVACDATKAAVTTTTSINTIGNTFLVDLIDMTDGSSDKLSVVKKSEVVTCSSKGDNGKYDWTMADIIYWQYDLNGVWTSRTLDAWSRYPASLNGGAMSVPSALSEEGAEIITYNGDNQAQLSAERKALKFNYKTYCGTDTSMDSSEKQDDLLFAYSGGCKASENNGKIPVHFYHALAAVYFKFGEEKEGQTIEYGSNVIVKSLEISGIKRAGTCTFTPSNYVSGDPSSMFAWDTEVSTDGLDRAQGSYIQSYNQEVVPGNLLGGGTFETGKTFFVIPQALSGAELTVNWTKDGDSKMARTASISTTVDKNGNPYNVVWKAGYKYLYTIRIINNGAGLALDLEVLPWDKSTESIDYSETVSLDGGKALSFTNCDSNESLKRYAVKNGQPVIVSFRLGAPKSGSWIVGLNDYSYFDVSPTTGPIGTEDAVVYVTPKEGVDRSVEHTVKLKISVRRADGRTISADEVLDTDKYTIVLPKAE